MTIEALLKAPSPVFRRGLGWGKAPLLSQGGAGEVGYQIGQKLAPQIINCGANSKAH
jgi:hypothetical protein